MSDDKLIVGLGNPGKDYELTRHNLGFLVVEEIVQRWKLKLKSCSFTKALTANGINENGDIHLLMPTTYVNNSGSAVSDFLRYKKLSLENILVVCDDINLSFGEMRLKKCGSAGGHNGLKSIISILGTDDFARLRLGVGHPGSKEKVVQFVLEDFSKDESKNLDGFIDQAADCCLQWIENGINKAMSDYNKRKKENEE